MEHESIDEECVARVRAGDLASFERLMRRHNQRLFRAARAVLGADAEAEDVVQDAYVRAYTALDTYRPGNFGGWVLTIVLNEARSRKRKALRRQTLLRERDPLVDASPAEPQQSDPEGELAGRQLRRVVEQAIDTLPEDQRLVFVLRELEQLSTRETAALTGSTDTAVRSRLHRGKAALRVVLSERIGRELADAFSFAGARCDRIVAGVQARLQRLRSLTH